MCSVIKDPLRSTGLTYKACIKLGLVRAGNTGHSTFLNVGRRVAKSINCIDYKRIWSIDYIGYKRILQEHPKGGMHGQKRRMEKGLRGLPRKTGWKPKRCLARLSDVGPIPSQSFTTWSWRKMKARLQKNTQDKIQITQSKLHIRSLLKSAQDT